MYGNAQIILTKNSVLQKTVALLQAVQADVVELAGSERRFSSHQPKISRGENYLGLPYVVLDYPRFSAGDDLFFVRSFFWWGHFYSVTLQLAGEYKRRNLLRIAASFEGLGAKGYSVGINADPWVHHFGEDNYAAVDNLSGQAFRTILHEIPHTKIAVRWPLHEWDTAANNLVESWRYVTGLVA